MAASTLVPLCHCPTHWTHVVHGWVGDRERYDVELVVTTFDGSDHYEAMRAMQSTDVLVGMHGASMAHSIFLPPVRCRNRHSSTCFDRSCLRGHSHRRNCRSYVGGHIAPSRGMALSAGNVAATETPLSFMRFRRTARCLRACHLFCMHVDVA